MYVDFYRSCMYIYQYLSQNFVIDANTIDKYT